ncbi:ATP-binding protein [Robertkochia aurantiaca]|uniref:ATP-binding protein n=1 Tax=Robertkochia aurantiaca TaxID=2873700 RepID=UPI001CCF6801|nr:ATP-binding protein [Robertkochia sp. 3YJGBD-33]
MKNSLFSLLLILVLGCSEQPPVTGTDSSGTVQNALDQVDTLLARKAYDAGLELNAQLLQENNVDTLKPRLLIQRMRLFRKKGNMDSLLYYAERYRNWAHARQDSLRLADALWRLGFYHSVNNDVFTSQAIYLDAIELNKAMGDSLMVAKLSNNLTIRLLDMGIHAAAERMAVQGLEYLGDRGPDATRYKLYNGLGRASSEQLQFEEADYWYQKARVLTGDTLPYEIAVIENNRAVNLMRKDDYKQAIVILDSILNSGLLEDSNRAVLMERARITDNLAYSLYKTGIDTIAPLFEKALSLRDSLNDLSGVIASKIHMADYYAGKDLNKANQLSEEALQLAREEGESREQLRALRQLIENAPDARTYALAYRDLKDSLDFIKNKQQNLFAKVQYDAEENRQRNQQLQTEAAERELELARVENRNLVLAIVIAALLIITFLWQRIVKAKHLKERLEEISRTENRISKQIHDELANDVYHTMSYVESNTAVDREPLLTRLETIYRRTRDISKQNAQIPLKEGYEQALKDMLQQFQSKKTNVLTKGIQQIEMGNVSDHKKLVLYRILQEMMVNMHKHAEASLVIISFRQERKKLLVEYKDNGKGTLLNGKRYSGGLANTENRIESVGGSISFDSRPGKGFTATISVPL